jgi:hypothetical protein
MLADNFNERSLERAFSAQPFIDNDAQGILIAGRAWSAMQLLRGHIRKGSRHFFGRLRACTLRQENQAKIAQQDRIIRPDQHVLRFDVSMNELFLVGVLES